MICKDMTILDIVEKHPSTQEVFKGYNEITGSCLMCQNLFSSLEETCLFYGLKIEDIIDSLEKAIQYAKERQNNKLSL